MSKEINTPDTEVEKAELAVFWDEIAQHLPKSIERSALGDEKIFRAFATAYPKMKKHLLTSRDTYWKERVRKEVEKMKQPETHEDHCDGYCNESACYLPDRITSNRTLDTLLDNLK